MVYIFLHTIVLYKLCTKIMYLYQSKYFFETNSIFQKMNLSRYQGEVLSSKSEVYCTILRSSLSEAKANPYLRDVQQEAGCFCRCYATTIQQYLIDAYRLYQLLSNCKVKHRIDIAVAFKKH